jgi:cytochrome b
VTVPGNQGNPLGGCVILIMWTLLIYLVVVTTFLLAK